MNHQQSKLKITLLWLAIATIGRLVLHPPGATPLTSLCVLIGRQFNMKISCLMILVSLFLSDMILAPIQGHAIFGWWSIFTYSGFLMITLCSVHFIRANTSFLNVFIFTGFSSIFFWVWTNFGTWLTTSIYPHNLHGFIICYLAAIPFLRNALLGDLIWVSALSMLLTISPRAAKTTVSEARGE